MMKFSFDVYDDEMVMMDLVTGGENYMGSS